MGTVTVDSTTQRYTSSTQPEPDILLLHTTEGMGWPGYNGGSTAPHDTVRPIRGVGIEVRRHYPYDHNAKALKNLSGGVETNRRGVIQVELRGTCDPKYRGNPDWYFWPDVDDAVLSALADYYRPIMARYAIPAKSMAEFVAYPKSYGVSAPQRLSQSAWNNGAGICGHQHAPENSHGDPGNFPVARFIRFLTGTTTPPTTLQRGDSGTYVTQLQRDLVAAGIALTVDGTYGPATEAAVRTFQASRRITVDGIAGPQTLAALKAPAPIEEETVEITETNARQNWTTYNIVKDVRGDSPDTAPRVTPSTLLEAAVVEARAARADVAALRADVAALAALIAATPKEA